MISTSVPAFRERLNRQMGEAIFLAAQRDLATDSLDRRRAVPIIANVISGAVLTLPVLIAASGGSILWLGWPGPLAIIIGGGLIALGVAIRPRRRRFDGRLYRSRDLPEMFSLLDDLAARMGTEAPTAVALDERLNASMAEARDEHVLTVGAVLWRALAPPERIALLAHELAHRMNDDPARRGLTSRALEVLERWMWYLEPDADEFITEILQYLPFLAVSGLYRLLLGFVFAESQRAEYLADAIAARVSGSGPAIDLLRRLVVAENVETEIRGLYPRKAEGGLALIDRLARASAVMPPEIERSLRERDAREKLAVDATHPPTEYRIAFLNLLKQPANDIAPLTERMNAVDTELGPEFEKIGDKLKASLIAEDEGSW